MAEKVYGVADKAWQVVCGCDPHMPCAPRCWARKTVARIVECQQRDHSDRADFFRAALTDDLQYWSGKVLLDERHLNDPLKWRKPALIATGFHGDIGRLDVDAITRILAVACGALRDGHRFLFLTKRPDQLGSNLRFAMNRIYGFHWKSPEGISIGCSVMNQAEADRMRPAMAAISALGWRTHVWHEPAIGPVDWRGWEFIEGLITGGESGAGSRPMHPDWARSDRDWCIEHDVKFTFKQHGDWVSVSEVSGAGAHHYFPDGATVRRIGKKAAGCLLDGREWKEFPEVPHA